MRHFLGAFSFLTIIPVHVELDNKPGRIFAYFPLVGLVIGMVLVGIKLIPVRDGLSSLLVLVAWVAMTGGLHLDGFADSCDGLFATADVEHRLEIMKDPRVGTWGVVGLVLLLLGKFVLIGEVDTWLLVLAPVLGRTAMPMAAFALPYARKEGVGGYFREGLGISQVAAAGIICMIIVGLVAWRLGWETTIIIVVVPAVVFVCGYWAAGRLGGGITGDVYGALCEITELISLGVLSAF